MSRFSPVPFLSVMAALAGLALAGHSSAVYAAPVSYVISGTGTGTLGGTAFSNQVFSLTFNGDTTSVTAPNSTASYINTFSSTSFVIGSTTATLTGPADLFVYRPGQVAGVGNDQADIIDFSSASFSNYDLQTTFGPVVANGFATNTADPGAFISTSAGNLKFTSVSPSVTFQSVVGAVGAPEPGTLPLIGMGLVTGLGMVGTVKRRKRQVSKSK